ncbi:MAG: tRNA (adenosine(37)-N6)-dimethylallyltransferase MiaA [Firmicutes bacterium]|nr:tRNA (adenosine(37)-N6)-dimethylallyltransferase MiaA [Bacillota bacterium]
MIISIVGPTGVGKTKLSVELAKKYNAIVVNNDAMQVYKGMDIGTAKPTKEEMDGVTHCLFDFVDSKTNYTVYDYQKDARKLLEDNKDKNIVLVGGTGLYLKALLYDYNFEEETKEVNTYDDLSNEELYELALKKDKNMDIHINNRKRLVRFLNKENESNNNGDKLLYDNVIFIGLTTDRENLYKRIDDRVDEMINLGLLEEVKYFYDNHINSKATNTAIGYKELYQYFDGNISLDEAIDLIKKNSRHYAKRQYTWFNNQMNIKWFNTNYSDFNKTIDEVVNYIDTFK